MAVLPDDSHSSAVDEPTAVIASCEFVISRHTVRNAIVGDIREALIAG